MAAVTPTVLVGFEFDNNFYVGDPIAGRLDSTLVYLDGKEVPVDLTDRCISLSVSRGRSDSTQPFAAGSAQLTLRNEDGLLDPENTSSFLYPGVTVGRSVSIAVDALDVFTGVVSDISLSYTVDGESLLTIQATDALSKLAATEIPASTVFVSQGSGARVNTVLGLAAVNYTDTKTVSTGRSTLAAQTTVDATNTLQYLQQVERSEDGMLFVAADGTLTFRDRFEAFAQPVALTLSDDGTSIQYQSIERLIPIRELVNRLTATVLTTGNTLTSNDTTSQASFGIRSSDLGELLNSTNAAVTSLLSFILLRLSSSKPRVSQVATVLDALDSVDRDDVLALELGDPVIINFTPPGVQQLSLSATVDRIIHSAAAGSAWTTTLGLSARPNYFVVGDTMLGRLDYNILA